MFFMGLLRGGGVGVGFSGLVDIMQDLSLPSFLPDKFNQLPLAKAAK